MTLKEKNKIIKLGRANDRFNKYAIKVAAGPFVAGTALILLHAVWNETEVMLLGMGLLLLGCLIPMIWLLLLSIWGHGCKDYTYDLYRYLVEECEPDEVPSFEELAPSDGEAPLTKELADRLFDGDIDRAIDYVVKNIRGEELDAFIDEWSPEQAAAAIDAIYNAGKEAMGEKALEKCMDQQIVLAELGVTEAEVLTMPNPFKKKIWMRLGVLAAVCVGVPLLVGAFADWFSAYEDVGEWVLLALSCFITLQATTIAPLIIKSVKFARLKRNLRKGRQ